MTDTLSTKPLAKPGPTTTPLTETYWHHAEQGRLYLQQCGQCRRHQHYPGPMCRSCWSEELTWVEAVGTGSVWAFTIAAIPGHPAWRSETPYVLALVELDEGPRLMTNIVECPPDQVHVGQRVQLSSRPAEPGQPRLQFQPSTPPLTR